MAGDNEVRRDIWLGVDVGGTNTRAWLMDDTGRVLGKGHAPGANYQATGVQKATRNIRSAVDGALENAAVEPASVVASAYGVAGADRPKDFELVRSLLPVVGDGPVVLVNDSELVLHAGAPMGVGVGLIAGTGTNAVARSASGLVQHVGGMGWELGDFGSAGDIGREAVRQAMRGHDGRGEPTRLYEAICEHMGLSDLLDLVDLWMEEDPGWDRAGDLAPVVFEVAASGDYVAGRILRRAGREAALSAKVLVEKLFEKQQGVTVVLGGSVFQKQPDSELVASLIEHLKQWVPMARVVMLDTEPVLGAVLLAVQKTLPQQKMRDLRAALRESIGRPLVKPIV